MFLRFLLIGGTGFLIDAGLTYLLTKLGMPPWMARLPAIAVAMAFAWQANRRFTYEVKAAAHAGEALRYGLVAGAMAVFNYVAFVILVAYGLWPVAAITIATACQTVLSFHAYRRLVFRVSKS